MKRKYSDDDGSTNSEGSSSDVIGGTACYANMKRKYSDHSDSSTNSEGSSSDVIRGGSFAKSILTAAANRKLPEYFCKNREQGCPIKTYSPVLKIHERTCPLIKMDKQGAFRGALNIERANEKMFLPFMRTKGVSACYKIIKANKTENTIKVCIVSKQFKKFTLTFYDRDKGHIYKSEGDSDGKALSIPVKVFREMGPIVKYKISF